MCFFGKKDLAAFKKKILIKNRTEIWLYSLLVCQDCNLAKYAIQGARTFVYHFPDYPWVLHLDLLNFQTIKKHTLHQLNQLISTNHWLCTKEIQILLIHYMILLSLNHMCQLNHHLGHLGPSSRRTEMDGCIIESMKCSQ